MKPRTTTSSYLIAVNRLTTGDSEQESQRAMVCRRLAMVFASSFLFLIGCSGSPGASSASSTSLPGSAPVAGTGDPNLDYWLALNQQMDVLGRLAPADLGGDAAENTRMQLMIGFAVTNLMQTNVENVDPELLAWSIKVVEAWQLRASLAGWMADEKTEKGNDPKHKSWLAYKVLDRWIQLDEQIQAEGSRLQMKLSQRYGKPFPPYRD